MTTAENKPNNPPSPPATSPTEATPNTRRAGEATPETRRAGLTGLLGETAAKHNIPLDAQFELTHRCNLKCIHCYLTGPDATRQELTLPEIESILDQLAAAGTLFLTITGGEAMIRPDFFQILNAAKQRHFAIILFTNATLIGPEEAEQLARVGVIDIGVSLYGSTAEVHDSIMAVPGSFDRAMNAIKLLIKNKLRVTLKSVIMKQNFHQRLDMIALAESMGLRYMFDPIITPRNDGSPAALGDRLSIEQTAELYKHPHFYPDTNQGPWEQGPDPACYAGRNTVAINPYGDVLPCLQFMIPMGNLREKTFADIWREQTGYAQYKTLKPEDLKTCSTCDLKQYCAICPGLALLETGAVTSPCPVACNLAKARKLFHDSK